MDENARHPSITLSITNIISTPSLYIRNMPGFCWDSMLHPAKAFAFLAIPPLPDTKIPAERIVSGYGDVIRPRD